MRYQLLKLYGAEGEDEGSEQDPPQTPPESSPSRTLTQEELEKMTARAADRASRSATKSLATELGFEKVSDLKAWATTQKEAQAEAQTEAEKAATKLAEDQAQVTTSQQALARERLEVKIERAVVRAGVIDEKKLDRLLTLVSAEVDNETEEDGWAAQIDEAIEAVKSDVPELFAGSKTPLGSGDGGAGGDSVPGELDEEAEKLKAYDDEYAAKGLVDADFSSL